MRIPVPWSSSRSTEHSPRNDTPETLKDKTKIISPKLEDSHFQGIKESNPPRVLPPNEWKELSNYWTSIQEEPPTKSIGKDGSKIHPTVALGLTVAFVAHGAILFSLPPVLRGKGAPFLPTAAKGLNIMFSELRQHPNILSKLNQKRATTLNSTLTFVDLGSGDGRVVFRAAREGLFDRCVGYEINPGT